jgi:glycosyltransferase involved in cell wall biosynthesis
VAGSDSGAIPEVIGDPAMIFPVGDVPALAGLVRRCCNESSFFKERQLAQSRRVREQYTHEKVAQIHVDFLKSL